MACRSADVQGSPVSSCRGRGEAGRARLPGWVWAAAAAAVYHGSKCISSSLCLLHTGLGLRLVLGLGRLPLAPATVPSLSPPLALGMGLTLCWLSLHLSPSVRTKPMVRQATASESDYRHQFWANVTGSSLGKRTHSCRPAWQS